ncbi:MAG TPA: hypothetical protein ENH82_07300 [bacterium]|nr:hypothetical protein [bacterium]
MKKVLLVLLGVLFCVSAFADRDTAPASFQSEQYILNRIFESSTSGFIEANRSGTMVLHRDGISDDDAFGNHGPYLSADNTTVGLGIDLTGWKRAMVFVKVSTDTGCIITPWFGNSTASRYFAGDSEQVSSDSSFLIEVNGEDDFYVSVDDISLTAGGSILGVVTTSVVDVYVTGTN